MPWDPIQKFQGLPGVINPQGGTGTTPYGPPAPGTPPPMPDLGGLGTPQIAQPPPPPNLQQLPTLPGVGQAYAPVVHYLPEVDRRSQLLLKNGYDWLPPQTLFSLATARGNDADMMGYANAIAGTLKGSFEYVKSISDDPVLAKNDSVLLTLKRYLNGSTGVGPFAGGDLKVAQQNLQKAGYGAGLNIDGVWNPGWSAAYRSYTDQLVREQYAGKQPGSLTIGSALKVLGYVLPVKAANAVVGTVLATPGLVRQLAADTAGGIATVPGAIAGLPGGISGVSQGAHDAALNTSSFVLGKPPDQVQAEYSANPIGHIIDDVGTSLLLTSAFQAGGRIATAAARDAVAETAAGSSEGVFSSAAAYQRGLGPVSEGLSGREAANAAKKLATDVGYDSAARGPGIIANTVGRGLDIGDAKFLQNFPVLNNAGPWIAKLNDADGWYYRARSALAAPMQFRPVQLASQGLMTLGTTGVKIGALAEAEKAVGGGQIATAVQGAHYFDPIDDQIKRTLQFTALGQHIQPSLNWLGFVMHPMPGGAPSEDIGAFTKMFTDDANTALAGRLGSELEHGLQMPLGDFYKMAGGADRGKSFLSDKAFEHASYFGAERDWRLLPPQDIPAKGTDAWKDFIKARASEIRNNPEMLDQALYDMLGVREELANRLIRARTSTATAPDYESKGISAYLDASQIVHDHLLPHDLLKGATAPANGTGAPAQPGPLIRDTSARLGIAKLDTLTRQDALRLVDDYRSRLPAVEGTDPVAEMALRDEINTTLLNDFGIDGRRMPPDLPTKIDMIEQRGQKLASRVFYHADAPAEVGQAFRDLKDLGYMPVVGHDIGFLHANRGYLTALDEYHRGLLTNMSQNLGISTVRVDSPHVAARNFQEVVRSVQQAVDAGDARLPPHSTVNTVLADLNDSKIFRVEPNLWQRAVMGVTGYPRKRTMAGYLEDVQASHPDMTPRDSVSLAKEMAREDLISGLQKRDLPRGQVMKFLTRNVDVPRDVQLSQEAQHAAETGEEVLPGSLPYMDPESASAFYRAMVRGYARTPAYMVGATRIENIARAGFGFVGEKMLPTGHDFTDMVANLPNNLIRYRNQLRFQFSPEFSIRRIAKTNLKIAVDGVSPTINPARVMEKAGTLHEDRGILDRVMPEQAFRGQHDALGDSFAREMRANDVFGWYSPRDYEAYAAGQWARQGFNDSEIRERLVRDFDYGTYYGGKEGRSALEKTTNFFFFPFSFDKTLYRNFGAYLLDHPGKMILLSNALSAYNTFNQAHQSGDVPGTSSWLEKHLPIATEISRLNAFAHGVSAGEPGGLDAELLPFFLPQSWEPSKQNIDTFLKAIPAYKDMNRFVGKEIPEQYKIAKAFGTNFLRPDAPTPGSPGTPAETANAQITDALALQRQLYSQLANTIEWNNKNRNSPDKQIYFPGSRSRPSPNFGKFSGQLVDKTTIRFMLHERFPAYDPNFGATFAEQRNKELREYELSIAGTDKTDTYDRFIEAAHKVALGIQNGSYDTPADEAQATAAVRGVATDLASTDSSFFAMYKRQFQTWFGPLERVS